MQPLGAVVDFVVLVSRLDGGTLRKRLGPTSTAWQLGPCGWRAARSQRQVSDSSVLIIIMIVRNTVDCLLNASSSSAAG